MENTGNPETPSVLSPSPPVRKLVSVRQISKIERIRHSPFAVAHLDGWQVVVGARQYKIGDLVMFFEIDSFIPNTDQFWELFADPAAEANTLTFRGREGYRVQSTRLFGRLSQGLILPLADFPDIIAPYQANIAAVGYQAATGELLSRSFAEALGVVKWEFTECAQSLPNLGQPPAFICKPGWFRIQDIEKTVFAPPKRKKVWAITEKLDGVTMTVYKIAKSSVWAQSLPALPDGCPPSMQDESNRYGVCSRTEDLIDRDDNLYWQTAKASGVLRELPRINSLANVAVLGELCGSSIEGNTMNYPEGKHEFVVFSIWDIDKGRYLPPKQALDICRQHQLKHAPVVGFKALADFAEDMDDLLRKAEGEGQYGGIREGFVFQALDGADHFKVISNRWLEKTGK